MAHSVNVLPRCLPGNPAGFSCHRGDFSVQRHGVFEYHPGSSGSDIMEKNPVLLRTGFLQDAFLHRDAGLSQDLNPSAGHERIRVRRADKDAPDSGFQQGVGTGRCFSKVAARFQRHIQVCSRGGFAAAGERVALRVEAAVCLVISLPDYLPVFHDDGSDDRVRGRPSPPFFCQVDGTSHICLCVQRYFLLFCRADKNSGKSAPE